MAIPEMSGGAKGGMGMSDIQNILDQVPKVDYNPAPVAPPATPDFNAQLSNFYGDDPMKITQPYQDYYKTMPLPGDESQPAPTPEPTPPVVTPPVRRDETAVRNQGRNMDFVDPMVGTVEVPDIAPGAFRYGGRGTMEDFGMGGGFFPKKISRRVPQQERRDDGLINRPSPARISTAFDDPRGFVQPSARQMPTGLGGTTSIIPTPRMPMNEQPPMNLFNTGGFSTGGMMGAFPQMPILDAAPKPKGRVATLKKKKRTARRGGGRRLS
jgi:hypothetical protein